MDTVLNLSSTFLLGLLTPLTAVCVLPLYPGFISFLTGRLVADVHPSRPAGQPTATVAGALGARPAVLGLLVSAGVMLFMLAVGVVFATIIEVSLTRVIGVVSPVAFGVLASVSVLLILNVDVSRLLRQARVPRVRNPYLSALLYGLFFGAIVIPCNPGIIAAFFAKTLVTSTGGFLLNMVHFLLFAAGIGLPLLVIAVVSGESSGRIVRFLVMHKSTINRFAGALMLGISIYYLVFVFRVFGG